MESHLMEQRSGTHTSTPTGLARHKKQAEMVSFMISAFKQNGKSIHMPKVIVELRPLEGRGEENLPVSQRKTCSEKKVTKCPRRAERTQNRAHTQTPYDLQTPLYLSRSLYLDLPTYLLSSGKSIHHTAPDRFKGAENTPQGYLPSPTERAF